MKRLITILFFSQFSILTSHICSAQYLQWAKNVGTAANKDYGRFIAVDTNGNTLVTGTFQGTADFDPSTGVANLTSKGLEDIYFAKYDANGNYVWAKSLGSISSDYGYGIETDNSGNTYITGFFQDTVDFDPSAATATITSIGNEDIFFAKYDANGNYVWAKSIGSTRTDYGSAIKLDKTGNIYVVGVYQGSADFDPSASTYSLTVTGTDVDIFFAKYDVNGNFIWANSIGGSGLQNINSNLDIDKSGNVYITGYFQATADFDPSASTANLTSAGGWDIYLAKYSSNGNYIWANSIGSTTDDFGACIDIDLNGNVLLNGYFTGTADFDPSATTNTLTSSGSDDIFIAKYDSLGNYKWANSIGSSGSDYGYFIQADIYGNAYAVGSFQGTVDFDPSIGTTNLTSSGSDDAFYAKYDVNGALLWANKISSIGTDAGAAIKLDKKGNEYVTGYFGGVADFDPTIGVTNLTPVGTQDVFFMKLYVCNTPDTISGLITGPGAIPIDSGKVYVYKYQPGPNAGFLDTVGFAVINSNGIYKFPALPYGDYFVEAVAATSYTNAVSTYYSTRANNYRWDSATFVPHVGCAGLHYPNINITVIDLPVQTGTGIISGNVFAEPSYGMRLAGSFNNVMGAIKSVDVKLGKKPAGGCTNRTTTDVSGNYSFTQLDTGSYFVYVDIPNYVDTISILHLTSGNSNYANINYCVDSMMVHYCSNYTTKINQIGVINEQASVYPNPNNGTFTIKLNEYENTSVEVYNTIGQKLLSQALQTNLTQLSLAGFSNGMYQLRLLKGGNSVYQTKVVKQE